jgi:hypothetical protein
MPAPLRKEKGLINESPSSGETSSASEATLSRRLGRRLLRYGIVLFLLGLATGRLVQSPLPSSAWAFPVTCKA